MVVSRCVVRRPSPAGCGSVTSGQACLAQRLPTATIDDVTRTVRRGLALAVAVLLMIGLSGCSAYPDGVVARRADGLYARSHCPAGSLPQVVSAEVVVNGQTVWAAHAKAEAAGEIPLLRETDGIVVTVDNRPALSDHDTVDVAVTTLQSTNGGADFRLADLPVGDVADRTGDTVGEEHLPAPSLLAGIDCGGLIPGVSMYLTVQVGVLLGFGILVCVVLASRTLKR